MPPPIRYANLGRDKRLSEIVVSGSHDASITAGSVYAQTQDLDIAGQANAGVRLFDLRILAQAVGKSDTMLVGYHGMPKGDVTRTVTSHIVQNKTYDVAANKKISGEFGLGLVGMLRQAKTFVDTTQEFLIFKFDKCTNYAMIADYCKELLGNSIFKPIAGTEFGQLSLTQLAGKVVCVFNEKERDRLAKIPNGNFTEANGILGFRSLRDDKGNMLPYVGGYLGLQYFGKGGTNPKKVYQSNKMKMINNRNIQEQLMLAMARVEDDYAASVLGMMYWTSTGATSSIRERNDMMWDTAGVRRMKELWHGGLDKAVEVQMQRDEVCWGKRGGVKRMKAYFPNIIMVDFADQGKCQTIYDLNTAADTKLATAYVQYFGTAN